MGGAHSSENRWTLRFRKCWSGSPAPVNAELVDSQPGGETTLNELRGAKPTRIAEFGTPHKRPMSSSGRQSVEVMMMMMMEDFNRRR
ncbi:jg16969 [Pararge aegeria aegeria]|uniref:Jg16969 protein n=1 Tax=Pararge aegeria aegeria TaxID=348720 RepID=A0A8S4RJC0_9NEOP|nr:jg16969 [Pararge aegeria aegeria]